ncbi:MAG: Fe-S cluster assembly protein SufD [Candidatus Marinimicrobia bacterium]|nr:Fe-S cluster assembly protein SufD [Candidatus Neomarinimicrobiota bacterium]|tara:strand:+ start:1311 stop:2483 length:1173 start_codon:yes stop_codon:yes gene_type:complete
MHYKTEPNEFTKFISKMDIPDLNVPNHKDEEWRFTNLDFLKDYNVNDFKNNLLDTLYTKFISKYSNINELDILNINDAIIKYPDIINNHFSKIYKTKNDYFGLENLKFINDGIFILVKENSNVKQHIEIDLSDLNESYIFPRIFIYCSKNSSFGFTEKYKTKNEQCYTNIITEIFLSDSSKLEYTKLQNEPTSSIHFSGLGILQKRNSYLNCNTFTYGSKFTRNNLFLKINGEGSESKLNGLSISNNSNFVDNHSIIQHSAPNSISSELYKGIYSKKSKGVFDSRVMVDKIASNTSSEQLNNNILLSKNASVQSNPILEINTDDVSCKHGSTTGQIDDEALFYLNCRGLNKLKAHQVLLNGFCNEFVENIINQNLKLELNELINHSLNSI